jgi:hypothetical protein
VTPRNLVERYKYFGKYFTSMFRIGNFGGRREFLRNCGIFLPSYTVSHSTRHITSNLTQNIVKQHFNSLLVYDNFSLFFFTYYTMAGFDKSRAASLLWWLSFVLWCLILLCPQYGTICTSPTWRLHVSSGSYIFRKRAHFCAEDPVMLPITFSTFPTSSQIVSFRQVRSLSPTSASVS